MCLFPVRSRLFTIPSGSDKHGFTLLDLLIGMVIGLIVLGAVISVFIIQNQYYAEQDQIVEMHENARAAMQIMVGDLRMAGYDPTGNAGAGIIFADGIKINFTRDITGGESDGIDNDGDGTTDEADESIYPDEETNDSNEDITYEYIEEVAGEPIYEIKRNGTVLIENVNSFALVYFGDSGLLSVPIPVNNIRRITIQIETGTRDGKHNKKLTSNVVPRNLGL